MYSIYHFFKYLVLNKDIFHNIEKITDFPFDKSMLSCQNKGIFPDLALRINSNKDLFSGGELIEIKDSKRYSISSFNSTIPTGEKNIDKIIKSENSKIKKQMLDAGDDIYSLQKRSVYYLIRGKNKSNTKIVIIHGSFFETVNIDNLIRKSFEQVLDERLKSKNLEVKKEIKDTIIDILSEQ